MAPHQPAIAVMARNLHYLSLIFDIPGMEKKSRRNAAPCITGYQVSFSFAIGLTDLHVTMEGTK